MKIETKFEPNMEKHSSVIMKNIIVGFIQKKKQKQN